MQAEFISINKDDRLIAKQLEVFAARKTNGAERCENAIAGGSFRGVSLTTSSSKSDKAINKGQFYDADPAWQVHSQRLMPESERGAIDCLNVLLPSVWPVDEASKSSSRV